MTTPRVSVLVAAYRSTFLQSALESALGQTQDDLEVVVVDDSEGESVRQVVDRLGDSRVRYLRNDSNLGPAASHQRAIAEASAPIVGILNDDDVWETDLVEELLGALDSTPSAVLAFADHWVGVDGERDEQASIQCSHQWHRDALAAGLHQPFQRVALVDRSVPISIAALFRRASVGGEAMPSEVGGAYDLYLSYRLGRGGNGAVYVPRRLATWRKHPGNLTEVASPERAEEGASVYRILAGDPQLRSLHKELRAAYGDALWSVATRNLRYGRRARAVTAALQAATHGRYKALLLVPAALLPRRLFT